MHRTNHAATHARTTAARLHTALLLALVALGAAALVSRLPVRGHAAEGATIPQPLQFSASAYTAAEGAGSAAVTVTRMGASDGQVSVDYATSAGTALAGADYTQTAGTLLFNGGETSKTFAVPLAADALDEDDETINLTLSNTTGVAELGSPSTAVLTIADDDAPPAVSVGDVSLAEGDFGRTNFVFPITLSAPSSKTVTVNYMTADGTAVGGGNDFFLPASNSVQLAPGETTASVTIEVIGDLQIEPDETFFLNLTGVTNASVVDGQGLGTILNDDAPPNVSLSISDASVVEGNTGTTPALFTVSLSSATSKTVTVEVRSTGGAGTDYQGLFATLTFQPGDLSKTVTLHVFGDTVAETDEQYEVTLHDPANATLGDGVGVLTITDDDGVPAISVGDASIVEGDSGTKQLDFEVTLSSASSSQVVFQFGTAAGTAAANADFMEVGGASLFAPGITKVIISVPVVGDTIAEADESFFLRVSLLNGPAVVADGEGVGTIRDDDEATGPPTVQFSAREHSVGEGAGRVEVTVTRSGDDSAPFSVGYATRMDNFFNAASERSDYLISLGTLRFAAGERSKTFTVFITDDSYAEQEEFITLTLSDPTGGVSLGEPVLGTIRIADNDPVNGPNPMRTTTNGVPSFNADFFVRQQYLDFFNREGDQAGVDFWRNQITSCGADQACIDFQKERVSSEFFRSIEFQTTGYFVYRAYAAAFGPTRVGNTVPLTLREFLPDTQQIGRGIIVGQGDWQAQLEANRVAYINDFVSRPLFTAQHPSGSQTPAQFVDALNANTGGSLSQAERDALVNGLTGGTMTRAQAFRAVVEDADFAAKERNRAFVLMQYFGYMRRNPPDPPELTLDYQGYNFWLGKLNEFGGDAVAAQMVKAFIISEEYKLRFGP